MKTQLSFLAIKNHKPSRCADHFDISHSSALLEWDGLIVEKGTAAYFNPQDVYTPDFLFSMELTHDFDWSIETSDVSKAVRTTVGSIWMNAPKAPINHINNNPAEFLVLAITPQLMLEHYDGTLPKDGLSFLDDYSVEDTMLGQIMNMFLLEVINQGRNGSKLLKSLLTLLATYYIENYSNISCLRDDHQHNSMISNDHMRMVDQYIYDHMDTTISIDALATELGMNKFHFLNEFKKKLDQTPYQYILTLRIDEAKNLLINTNDPLTDIALELGFNDGSHFSRTFKKFTGQTPLQFRKTTQ